MMEFARQSQAKHAGAGLAPPARPARARPGGQPCRACAGNQQLQSRLLARGIQPKLTVNQPGDRFEQEADHVADQVMRMPDPAAPSGIQRVCAHCRKDLGQDRIQRSCDECEKELQRKPHATRTAPTISNTSESQIRALRVGGEALPATVRAFFQPRFGHDFADVRVHTTGAAAETARHVDALAYTMGKHIIFAPGQYAPDTSAGRRLLAHELVHTIQQTGPGVTLMRREGDGHDLRAARFAGDPVLEACFDDERLLKFGSRGAAVEKVQQAVVEAGFPLPIHGVDGIFGPETKTAVQNYQQAHELSPDGEVGPLTMGVLDDQFAAGPPGPAPAPPAPAPPPACATVPSATPADCLGRNAGYCSAAACFPANPWLDCVCTASLQICQAVDAFSFKSVQGMQAELCIDATVRPPTNIGAKIETGLKGQWFLDTNKCIWGHWRQAFDALHLSAAPVPSTLTSPWKAAVATCRSKGLGTSECCKAQVDAEQQAIDTCGAYNSPRFGSLPTDIPFSPFCSLAAQRAAPPPAFTGDFGKVADRIKYGHSRCCP